MNGKNKGSSFERLLCKKLSLWWSCGQRSDIFWRTSNSGGRATFRNRREEKTTTHCGDICAIDPLGEKLFNYVVIEAKKGYNKNTLQELFDKPKNGACTIYEQWFRQAEEERKNRGCAYWMVIHGRDRREVLVFFPFTLHLYLLEPPYEKIYFDWKAQVIVCCRFQDFLDMVSPMDFR